MACSHAGHCLCQPFHHYHLFGAFCHSKAVVGSPTHHPKDVVTSIRKNELVSFFKETDLQVSEEVTQQF